MDDFNWAWVIIVLLQTALIIWYNRSSATKATDAVNYLEKQINSNLARQIAAHVAEAVANERLRANQKKVK